MCHLAVAQDMALVLSVVVAYELLLALTKYHPVAILYSRSIACTVFLLLHLGIKLSLVNSKAILTADKLGKVERETISVEQAECLNTVELCLVLLLKLFHCRRKEVDTLLKCAQE